MCSTCYAAAVNLVASGQLRTDYPTSNGMAAALKSKVKKKQGLTGRNLFREAMQRKIL